MNIQTFKKQIIVVCFFILLACILFKVFYPKPQTIPSSKNYSPNSAKYIWPTALPENSQKEFYLFVLKNGTLTNIHSVPTTQGLLFNDAYYFLADEQNMHTLRKYSLKTNSEEKLFLLPTTFSLKGIDSHAIGLIHTNYPNTPIIYMIDPSTGDLMNTFPSSVNANGDPQYLFTLSDGQYIFWIPDGDGCVSEGLVAKGKTSLHNIITLGLGCNQDVTKPMYLGISEKKQALIVGKFSLKPLSHGSSSCAYTANQELHYTQLLYYYPQTERFEKITDLDMIPDTICEIHVLGEKIQIITEKHVILFNLATNSIEHTFPFNNSHTFWQPVSETELYYLTDHAKDLVIYNLASQQKTSYGLDSIGVNTQSTTFQKYQFVGTTSDGSPVFLLETK